MTKQYALLDTVDAEQDRRSDYDVTNTVHVSSPPDVRSAVQDLFEATYARASFDPVWLAFHDFELFFRGLHPDYHGVDTAYHDIQHTLDVTLAVARLVVGYESSVEKSDRLGPERARLALVAALFHDFGYLRHRERDRDAANGAEFTRSHVSRGGTFLEDYLVKVGLGEFAPVLEEALEVENIDDVGKVAWLGDGATGNWTLADQLCPDAVQILDWHHAV